MMDGSKSGLDLNKSQSISFLETITRSLPPSTQFGNIVGTAFLDVLWRLQNTLEELSDEREVGQLIAELYSISNESPHAWRVIKHLVEKLQPLDQVLSQKSSSTIITQSQSKPTLSSDILTGYMEKQFPVKDWYLEVDYVPGQYRNQEAKLYVTLTDEPSNNSTANFKLQSLGHSEKIAVSIDGLLPYFDPIGTSREERLVSPNDRQTTFVFRLRPLLASNMVIVTANIFVLDRQEDAIASAKKTIKLTPDTLDVVMRVWKEDSRLCFSLRFAAELSDRDMGSKPIEGDPKEYLEKVHRYLNKLASPSDDIDISQLRRNLEELGMQLYTELFPDKLKQLYWGRIHDLVQTWQLLLDSDASQIPWELLVPVSYEGNQPKERYKFLCEQHQLGRWLLANKEEGVPALPQLISISPLALVSYNPSELDGIAKEKDQLQRLSGLRVSEVLPNHKDLEALLSSDTMQGCFGLHLSGDGEYDEDVKGCSFQLEDVPLTESSLIRPENRAFGLTSPFVFLNFCESGQVGNSLTGVAGIRGWIQQFMEIHASCIVATMWKANDKSAPDFSCTLYRELLNGKSIGEAMQSARKHIMTQGDATWLCYVLYGDPRAKVILFI